MSTLEGKMRGMSLRHALLGLLVDQPASGYDLLKRFDGSLSAVWPATQSQVYTELTKLAGDELIRVWKAGPRGRKEYALTDAGLVELRRWLTETKPTRQRRNDVLLRVFFLGVLSREQGIDYLDGLAATASRELDGLHKLEEETDWDDSDLSVYGRISLEYGLRYTAMRRDWAAWAVDQLTDRPE